MDQRQRQLLSRSTENDASVQIGAVEYANHRVRTPFSSQSNAAEQYRTNRGDAVRSTDLPSRFSIKPTTATARTWCSRLSRSAIMHAVRGDGHRARGRRPAAVPSPPPHRPDLYAMRDEGSVSHGGVKDATIEDTKFCLLHDLPIFFLTSFAVRLQFIFVRSVHK